MKRYKIKMWKYVPRWIKRKEYINERYCKGDYMNVYFFENEDEMYDVVDKLEGEKIGRDYLGRCYTELKRYWELDTETGEMTPTDRYSPMCGNLYFLIDKLGVNTVSHECLHATIGYFARKISNPKRVIDTNYDVDSTEQKNAPCDDIEELMCYMHGGIVQQVWEKFYEIDIGGERDEEGEFGKDECGDDKGVKGTRDR